MNRIFISKPLFCLSKKYYATGEVAIEFIIQDNQDISSHINLTVKDTQLAEEFKLKEYYDVSFTSKEKEVV